MVQPKCARAVRAGLFLIEALSRNERQVMLRERAAVRLSSKNHYLSGGKSDERHLACGVATNAG